MKKILITSLALLVSLSVFAQTSGTGIGARIGTGIDFTAKFWTGEITSIDLAAGLDYSSGWGTGVHADVGFSMHSWSWGVGQDQMKVYYGPGIGLGLYTYENLNNNFQLETKSFLNIAVRAQSGVAYYFHNIPLECFVELTPLIWLLDPNGFDLDFDVASHVGARWYF